MRAPARRARRSPRRTSPRTAASIRDARAGVEVGGLVLEPRARGAGPRAASARRPRSSACASARAASSQPFDRRAHLASPGRSPDPRPWRAPAPAGAPAREMLRLGLRAALDDALRPAVGRAARAPRPATAASARSERRRRPRPDRSRRRRRPRARERPRSSAPRSQRRSSRRLAPRQFEREGAVGGVEQVMALVEHVACAAGWRRRARRAPPGP